MLELVSHNHKQHLSLYKGNTVNSKLSKFLESQKLHNICNMCSWDFPALALGFCVPVGLMSTYQANPSCPCYIYNMLLA